METLGRTRTGSNAGPAQGTGLEAGRQPMAVTPQLLASLMWDSFRF
jgi:hypothetical protein